VEQARAGAGVPRFCAEVARPKSAVWIGFCVLAYSTIRCQNMDELRFRNGQFRRGPASAKSEATLRLVTPLLEEPAAGRTTNHPSSCHVR
jgi:hypothetical protein